MNRGLVQVRTAAELFEGTLENLIIATPAAGHAFCHQQTVYVNPTHHLAASVVYDADRDTRRDLIEGVVTSERDYASTFATRVRDRWVQLGRRALVHSTVLPGRQEQALGCDIALVLRWDDFAKVCLIEMKWPRFTTPSYTWDELRDSPRDPLQRHLSRFSSQIMRQSAWSGSAAIWEMFIHEEPFELQHRVCDPYGATCVTHDWAARFDSTYRDRRTPWVVQDVYNLVFLAQADRWASGRSPRNVLQMLHSVTSCRIGARLPIHGGSVTLRSRQSRSGGTSIRVPATLDTIVDDETGRFQEQTGVGTLIVLGMQPAADVNDPF